MSTNEIQIGIFLFYIQKQNKSFSFVLFHEIVVNVNVHIEVKVQMSGFNDPLIGARSSIMIRDRFGLHSNVEERTRGTCLAASSD